MRLPFASLRIELSSLGVRVIGSILLASTALATVVAAIQFAADYRREIAALETGIARTQATSLPAIAISVHDHDEARLRAQLRGLMQLPDIAGATVDTAGGRHYGEARSAEPQRLLRRTFDLTLPDTAENVGRFTLDVSLAAVQHRVVAKGLLILMSEIVEISIICLLILYIVHRGITRHLARISTYLQGLTIDRLHIPLTLLRHRGAKRDDLDLVTDAINDMRESLLDGTEERRRTEAALHAEKERLQVTLHSIGDAVISADARSTVTYLNPVAEQLTGWSCAQATGGALATVFQVLNEITRAPVPDPVAAVVRHGRSIGLALRTVLIGRDGREYAIEESAAPICNPDGEITGVVIVFRDVTEARAMQTRLLYQATHDTLTGLPNRTLLEEQLDHAITLAARKHWRVALLFIDLDRFKNVNDSLGHAAGDQLLKQVAARLLGCIRETDIVSRQGGDEFVIMLPDATSDETIVHFADRTIAAMVEPFLIDGYELSVTPSIGIAVYPRDGEDIDTLVRSADAAMYAAKDAGRNNYRFFSREMQQRAMARLSLEASLRQALAREEFVLHYQPQVEIETRAIVGVEALVRWRRPDGTLIPPAQFIPVAEESGLILALGEWVLRAATREARAWLDLGHGPLSIAVNLSAAQFRQSRLLGEIRRALDDSGLPPEALELELTESLVMADVEDTIRRLRSIKEMGIRLALDDFGTGYSSLGYLRRFPLDALKIDRTFVADVHSDPGAAAIALTIINLGRSLDLDVVAEGVELEQQLDFLRRHGCAQMQGYLFSPPVPAESLVPLLARHPRRSPPRLAAG